VVGEREIIERSGAPTAPGARLLVRASIFGCLVGTTITILSQKGGTGKTTTVRTLADAFRRAGLSVLTVDLDPQGNLSDYFDVPADAEPTMGDVLSGRATASEAVRRICRWPKPS
jgi:cellulose biosynthesis protein BcsQ